MDIGISISQYSFLPIIIYSAVILWQNDMVTEYNSSTTLFLVNSLSHTDSIIVCDFYPDSSSQYID